jgi:hypothetical protein
MRLPEDLQSATPSPVSSAPIPPPNADEPVEGTPWAESTPPGVEPLSDDERTQLGRACRPFVDAVAGTKPRGAGGGDPARIGIAEAILDVLDDPPRVAGVDVPRCAGLLRRDTTQYLARTREERAVVAMKTLLTLLEKADREKGALCPSAPAVPANIRILERSAYESAKDDFKPEGWSCLGYDPLGAPQRHQIQLVTKGGAYRIVARLFPVRGAAMTELYIEGKRPVDLGAPVMRRK